MTQNDLTLIEPSPAWQPAFLEMAADYAANGETRYASAVVDFYGYLQLLTTFARGENLPPGRVRETSYWGVHKGIMIGSIRLRHSLTPVLRQTVGHIGYDVRPSHRGQGYGTAMLAHTLERARSFGLSRVLLLCDADNIGSIRVIEKNGGRLSSQEMVDGNTTLVLHYWIDLTLKL